MFKIGLFVTLTFVSVSVLGGERSSAWSVRDAATVKKISHVEVSPDAKNTIYSVTNFYLPNSAQSQYFVRENPSGTVVLSSPLDISTCHASWFPDGKFVSYLAPGKKYQSLWVIPINVKRSKPIKILESDSDIESYQWSPLGNAITIIKKIGPNDSDINQASKPEPSTRLWFSKMEENFHFVGQLEQVSSDNISVKVEEGIDTFDWSPDGKKIVFSFLPKNVFRRDFHQALGVFDIESKKIEQLTQDSYLYHSPKFSHDGKSIAYLTNKASADAGNAKQFFLMQTCLHDLSNHQTQCLANTPDQGPRMIGWSQDNRFIFVQDFYHLSIRLYALPVNGGDAIAFTPENVTIDYSATLNKSGNYLGFSMETFTKAPDAYISQVDKFNPQKISDVQHVINKKIGQVKIVSWLTDDKTTIEGILILPPDYQDGHPVPLIVTPHGGPTSQWWQSYVGKFNTYNVPMSFAILSSNGFAVLAPNVRGSTGYGPAFRMANFKDLGGSDYKDMLSGIDHLVKANIVDPNKIGIWGWSYGGYLTAWAITQDARFKAAVFGAGLTDFISFDGTSDLSGAYLPSYLGKSFWEDNQLYLQRSPIMYVQNTKTPTMIQHGQDDQTVPVSQGRQFYNALTDRGVPVEMLVYKNQTHLFDNPDLLQDAMQRTLDWFNRYLG